MRVCVICQVNAAGSGKQNPRAAKSKKHRSGGEPARKRLKDGNIPGQTSAELDPAEERELAQACGEQVFDPREYTTGEVRRVQDECGTWRQAMLYHTKTDEEVVVLWYGGAEYEGIGQGYRSGDRGLVDIDGDGEKIHSRLCPPKRVREEFRRFQAGGANGPEPLDDCESEGDEGGDESEYGDGEYTTISRLRNSR